MDCDDPSIDETKIKEHKLECYYKHYKIPEKEKPIYGQNPDDRNKLKKLCLPKCPELPEYVDYDCSGEAPHTEDTECELKNCENKECNVFSQIKCGKTKGGMKWGTSMYTNKWTEIENFPEILRDACSKPPLGCLGSTRWDLGSRGSWGNCDPCTCPACSDLYHLYSKCTWTCPKPDIYPEKIAEENTPESVIATCKEKKEWIADGFNPTDYNENNQYCPSINII